MKSPLPPSSRRAVLVLGSVVVCLGLSGCIGLWHDRNRHEATSVVQFLYPNTDLPFVEPEIPTLRLPLRVGIAFVPESATPGGGRFDAGRASFTEKQRSDLLSEVATQFRSLPFVESIEVIPSTYLRPAGGFENLDQLRAMLGIDVIALISYDQVQNSRETEASLSYWTIIGAYTVQAQRNSTHTLMEATVYDIATRSLLFRAPGASSVKGSSTLFRRDYELAGDSERSLLEASRQMTTALARELDRFKVRAREEPGRVRIEHRPGYTGGGELDASFAGLVVVVIALNRRARS